MQSAEPQPTPFPEAAGMKFPVGTALSNKLLNPVGMKASIMSTEVPVFEAENLFQRSPYILDS